MFEMRRLSRELGNCSIADVLVKSHNDIDALDAEKHTPTFTNCHSNASLKTVCAGLHGAAQHYQARSAHPALAQP